MLSKTLHKSAMCAVGHCNPRKKICFRDSGGPLFIMDDDENPIQIGIVSFSYGGFIKLPDGYTRVSMFLDWISEVTGIPV